MTFYTVKHLFIIRNPNARTIESELLAAMVKAGVISQEGADDPGSKVMFATSDCLEMLASGLQGSKFVVAMVANATMFSHLLPGCSCGSKYLLLPYIFGMGNLVHAFLCNACNAISYAT